MLVLLLLEDSWRQLVIPEGVACEFCVLLCCLSNATWCTGNRRLTVRAVCIFLEHANGASRCVKDGKANSKGTL